MKKVQFLTMTLMIFSALAFGQNKPKVINNSQKQQQTRIAEGANSGELTNKEVKHLEKEQKEIQESKREAKSDGKFTRNERREVRKEQKKASKHIYKAKHDADQK
ncbi:MAG: hypothetical protein JNK41_05685 [Saprospiraceae bacterium]|jgi:hypothetical protein|nr:hypothetical protein [Saprospiraceae bacterium]